MKKIISVLMAASLILVLLAGCSSTEPKKEGEQKESQTQSADLSAQPIKIGVLPIEDVLPLYVAETNGKFKEAGLSVELVAFASAAERDAAMQAGQIDGEVADLAAAALLKKGGTDVKVGAIALGAKPEEGRFAILASPKSKAATVQDLKNVTVAISSNTITEFVGDQLLLANGLKDTDIKKIAVPKIPVRLQMLMQGQVEAAILPDPLATLAEKQGAKVLIDDTKGENITQVVFIWSKKAVDEKAAAIKKLTEVFGQAGQEVNANPDKYRSLFIEKARIPEPIKDIYKSPTFSPIQLPTESEVSLVMDWMVKKNLITKAYAYDELVDENLK